MNGLRMESPAPSLRIGFVHPDLGVGGAERLVADAVEEMVRRGHFVAVFTSHYDSKKTLFTNNGTSKSTASFLGAKITIRGDFLPTNIFGLFHLFFAGLRSIYLAMWIYLFCTQHFDIIFVDQNAISLPILMYCARKIVFYCHYPDKLLAKSIAQDLGVRGHYSQFSYSPVRVISWMIKPMHRIYRNFFDSLEEWSLSFAQLVLVNSKFTHEAFASAFPRSKHLQTVKVVYPGVRCSIYDDSSKKEISALVKESSFLKELLKRPLIISVNRFERKKMVELAIRAFGEAASLRKKLDEKFLLIIAGGFDERVSENRKYLAELVKLCETLSLKFDSIETKISKKINFDKIDVLFWPSVPENVRRNILMNPKFTRVLLYTPENEHFGIVPVEAMSRGVPVIALDSGGPRETIVDGVTGWLCSPDYANLNMKIESVIENFDSGSVPNSVTNESRVERSSLRSKKDSTVPTDQKYFKSFTKCLLEVMELKKVELDTMSNQAVVHVKLNFNLESFGNQMEDCFYSLM